MVPAHPLRNHANALSSPLTRALTSSSGKVWQEVRQLHDLYGLALDRVPDVIANTVQLIVDQLKEQAVTKGRRR